MATRIAGVPLQRRRGFDPVCKVLLGIYMTTSQTMSVASKARQMEMLQIVVTISPV